MEVETDLAELLLSLSNLPVCVFLCVCACMWVFRSGFASGNICDHLVFLSFLLCLDGIFTLIL